MENISRIHSSVDGHRIFRSKTEHFELDQNDEENHAPCEGVPRRNCLAMIHGDFYFYQQKWSGTPSLEGPAFADAGHGSLELKTLRFVARTLIELLLRLVAYRFSAGFRLDTKQTLFLNALPTIGRILRRPLYSPVPHSSPTTDPLVRSLALVFPVRKMLPSQPLTLTRNESSSFNGLFSARYRELGERNFGSCRVLSSPVSIRN